MHHIAEHVVGMALRGHTLAAADHLLVNDLWIANLPEATASVLREATRVFHHEETAGRERLTRFVLQLGMNLTGQEAGVLHLDTVQVRASLDHVRTTLASMERCAGVLVRRTVDAILADMRSVNRGDSLPAQVADGIAAETEAENAGRAFLAAFSNQVEECVYVRMARGRIAKFGNDYARGLEYLRHLGFVQVSTNPVLAAKAFDEDPALLAALRAEASAHPDWRADPDKHGDALAMRATLLALWPNLSVFRPLALRAKNSDYLVSFQLNPNLADNAELSLQDARAAYDQAREFSAGYDRLLGVREAGSVAPCLVFKVAGNHPAARTITRELNALGIGTNNTLVYTVSQAVQLTLDAFAGKAQAVRAGKAITRSYMTNMGGRFTSHLREVEAERIVAEAAQRSGPAQATVLLLRLAGSLQIDAATRAALVNGDVAEQARMVCAFKHLKSLDQPAFLELAAPAGCSAESIRTLEADLRKAGTVVARRVWQTFYAPANRERWVAWLASQHSISKEQAQVIHESMDVLPASKRVIEDTLHALGYPNMCHTEFPNHARAVQRAAMAPGFDLDTFHDSVAAEYPAEVVERLSRLPDFVAGHELTSDLMELLAEVGIAGASGLGRRGLPDTAWAAFGPCVKTAAEFRAAYDQFVARCRDAVRELGQSGEPAASANGEALVGRLHSGR